MASLEDELEEEEEEAMPVYLKIMTHLAGSIFVRDQSDRIPTGTRPMTVGKK